MTANDSHSDAGGQADNDAGRVATSRRRFLQTTATGLAAAGATGAGLTGSAAADGIPTPWLHRDGNLIKDPTGKKVILRGVNIPDPYRCNYAAPQYKYEATRLIEMATKGTNGWHSHIIRIPLQPQDIVAAGDPSIDVNAGMEEAGSFTKSDLQKHLRNHVDPAVQKCKEMGVYCILDYHRHYPWGPQYTDDALDEEITMFWETVAPRYAGESHVLFEVYNEPVEPYAGDDIYAGGPSVTDPESEETWLTWREAAQPWVDIIQNEAPEHLILIGSPRWTQWTWWAPKHEFEGENLAYTGHVYAHENMRPLSKYFGEPGTEVPVWMTEFGWGPNAGKSYLEGSRETTGQSFNDLFDNYPVHWTAWCFDFNWDPGFFDRSYEIKNDWGQWVKDRLAAKKDADLPTAQDGTTEPPTTEPDGDLEPVVGDAMPQNMDDDATVEDVTGDGELDFNDLVAYYQHKDDPAMQDHTAAYDYNDDGSLDFNDLVSLYQELQE